jgi:hypothetical protein
MTIIETVFKTETKILSTTFKTKSNVLSSVFKIGGVVSSTFKTGSATVSTVFRTGVGVVSGTFKIRSNTVSTIFKVSDSVLSEGVTYFVDSDCKLLTITIDRPELTSLDLLKEINISLYGTETLLDYTSEYLDDKIVINTTVPSDGIYDVVVTDQNDSVIVRMPTLVVSFINKCFSLINSKDVLLKDENFNDTNEWLLNYVLYRGIIANYRTRKYSHAMSLINHLIKRCEDFNNCKTC